MQTFKKTQTLAEQINWTSRGLNTDIFPLVTWPCHFENIIHDYGKKIYSNCIEMVSIKL